MVISAKPSHGAPWDTWAADIDTEARTIVGKLDLPGKTDKTRVLIVGSSNAAGSNASTFANSWAGRLASTYSATHTFTDVAVGGRSPLVWVTPDVTTGRSPLEQAIIDNRPHIVVAAYTTQNSGGPSHSFLAWINQTLLTCERYGARCVITTPYVSNDYTSAQRDESKRLSTVLRRKGAYLLDFASIWGTAATIPAAIDSGDGLHLNDTGHLEQFRQIPADFLSLSSEMRRAPRFDGITGGLLIPAGTLTGSAAITSGHPAGSWTVAFEMTLPSSMSTSCSVASWVGNNGNARIRIPDPAFRQLDVSGGIVHPAQTAFAFSSTHHVALTYNAITLESVLYIDGVAVSTVTAAAGLAFSQVALGWNVQTSASPATGFTYRNLTINATVLSAGDVSRLAKGVISTSNLVLALPLDDATARPVGGLFAATFGQTITASTGIALP